MKGLIKNLELEMQRKIESISYGEDDSASYAEEAVKIMLQIFEQLKASIKMRDFSSKEEEIEFFKIIKPSFSSKLIYYNEIFRIETAKPIGSRKAIIKHYNAEEKRLNEYFCKHFEFYKYYRSRSTNMDKKYFIRRKVDIKIGIESHFFQSDFEFNTSHDYLVAQIVANELLQHFLHKKRKEVKAVQEESIRRNESNNHEVINWTGSKVSLIELLYALQSSGVINNGNATLNSIATIAESVFNIKLKQVSRVFLEIKSRKSIEQTAFLNQLKENLLKKIQESDK